MSDLSSNTENDLLQRIFFPEMSRRIARLKSGEIKFAHYTSAEVAVSILRNKSIWMRNATTMNDFSEIDHGINCISIAWNGPSGERFKQAIEAISVGSLDKVAEQFNGWQQDMRQGTFLTCLSEHSETEDDHGRLSMWRAYGGRSGVALILNLTPFVAETDALGANSSPIVYANETGLALLLDEVAAQLETHRDLMRSLGGLYLETNIFHALRFAALCTKHPAFKEEREWRVVYSPNLRRSDVISASVEVVRGVPQIVQKVPLIDSPERGLHGADIPNLLHKIIIGPTEDEQAVFDAFKVLLTDAGVPDPEARIHISGVPLRQF